ncbi:hypothetical protein CHS0354_024126 [Potamilus streckersoni]|uniref:Enoyl-[acyl-carrier-protein] reductase (NADH) n=1 Tax=Potamilus streckersoni TaxID=2493646 RepID=A0AAE0VMR9_9BIVA|nr:hypothetical protein CHS0354_024126 [Potamilus streckersoni]
MNKEKKSYGLLEGKNGIVFGPLDSSSIGWRIAQATYREGAQIAISNVPIAQRVGTIDKLSEECGNAPLILCDASNFNELVEGFNKVKSSIGKIDFIIHSIGMSQNIRKGVEYEDVNYDWYMRTLDVSGVSLHKIISAALKTETINDGGSIVSLTYIASTRNFWTYADMGDAKSLLESITRSYGPRLARRGIRINTVSQSPTYTKAGSGISDFDIMYDFANLTSPLGNATADDCADYVVTLVSDFTRKVTMQVLYNDGGYSSVGLTIPALRVFQKAIANKHLLKDVNFNDFYPPEYRENDPLDLDGKNERKS